MRHLSSHRINLISNRVTVQTYAAPNGHLHAIQHKQVGPVSQLDYRAHEVVSLEVNHPNINEATVHPTMLSSVLLLHHDGHQIDRAS